jgi:hypothetical protein
METNYPKRKLSILKFFHNKTVGILVRRGFITEWNFIDQSIT